MRNIRESTHADFVSRKGGSCRWYGIRISEFPVLPNVLRKNRNKMNTLTRERADEFILLYSFHKYNRMIEKWLIAERRTCIFSAKQPAS
jgi:hypothetical protein